MAFSEKKSFDRQRRLESGILRWVPNVKMHIKEQEKKK
jgi:hypothetical protein